MKTLYTDGLLKFNAFFLEDVLKVEQVEEPEMGVHVTLVRDGLLTTVEITRRGMSLSERAREFARLIKALSKISLPQKNNS